MLFRLSLKNIRRSMRDYAIYFFTLIIGVAIFYVFNAIEKQSVMLNVTSSTKEIIKLMTNMLSGVSVFVSFILGGLIIYASRFLIKRRNKEFGIYLTLGMGKRKVSMILLIETLMIGIISLAVGMILGVCLSQFMSVLVANMFAADMTRFKFVFSQSACIKTIIYFSIMYLFVMVFNTFIISKCKLIDLLHAGKKSEKIRMKNPWLCTLIFIISAGALGYAYYLTQDGFAKLDSFDYIYIPIVLGAVSTFFIFWSLSGLIIKLVTHIKGVYYKGLNSFVVRQIVSKINTMVFSMTIICLMLFITVCVLSSALNINNSLKSNLKEATPVDLQLKKPINIEILKSTEWMKGHYGVYGADYNEEQMKSDSDTVLELYKRAGVDIENDFEEYIEFNTYCVKNLMFTDSLGQAPTDDNIITVGAYYFQNWSEDIIKLSDYNKVAELYGHKTFELEDGEYIIVADFASAIKIRNDVLEKGQKIEICGHTLAPKYSKCQKGFIELSGNHGNTGIIVVPDSVLDGEIPAFNYLTGNYKAKTDEEKIAMDEKINSVDDMQDKYILPSGSSKIGISEASIGLGAMVTFIGLYLGIIFLISSAAILALKELSESVDNIERYNMLRRLGADEKIIKKALFKQIGIFFLCPVILAAIHSIFGIQVCSFIIESLAAEKLLSSIVMTAGIILLIYGGYFILTYVCSKGIIRDKS